MAKMKFCLMAAPETGSELCTCMPTAPVLFLEKIIGEALKKLKSNVIIRGQFLINIQFTDDNAVDAVRLLLKPLG